MAWGKRCCVLKNLVLSSLSHIFFAKVQTEFHFQIFVCISNQTNKQIIPMNMNQNKNEKIRASIELNKLPEYKGEEKDGLPHNQGKQIWPNGDVYVGNFKEGMRNGYGELTYSQFKCKLLYKGFWKSSVKQGYGTELMIDRNHTYKYEGDWKDNLFDGIGFLKNKNSEYAGEFRKGKKDGYGFKLFGNGDTYDGYFKMNLFNGFGIYTYASSEVYLGHFQNGFRHGEGTFLHTNGDKYSGNFLLGDKDGKGIMTWENGEARQGVWRKGKLLKWIGQLKVYDCEGPFDETKFRSIIDCDASRHSKVTRLKEASLYRAAFRFSNRM